MVHVPGWPPVALAYASAAGPTVSEAVAAFRARGIARVAVASYFLAPGRLPDVVRRQAEDAGVPVTDVLGAAPELVRLALDRYDGTQASLRAAA
jgi:sirohydrochlorin ferrochelatase